MCVVQRGGACGLCAGLALDARDGGVRVIVGLHLWTVSGDCAVL